MPVTQAVVRQAVSVFTAPKAEAADFSIPELKDMAREIALEHGLNVEHFIEVIGCESKWDTYAEGDYPDGNGGWVPKKYAPEGAEPTSFGLVQIHYPTRDWGIATTTAFQPRTSMEIMAKAWAIGDHRKWSCWTRLYGIK